MNRTALAFILIFLITAFPAFAQESGDDRPSGLFFTGGIQYYIAPGKPFEKPLPGLRVGGGWELPLGPGSFALGVETGWTHTGLTGESRTADGAEIIPLAFRAGYGLPLAFFGLNAPADAITVRLDLLAGGAVIAAGEGHFTPFAGARLGAEYVLWGKPNAPFPASQSPLVWSVFLEGGADMALETDGAIALPVIAAGVKLRFKQVTGNREQGIGEEAAQQEAARQEAIRQETERQEAARQEAARQEEARQEAARQEAARQEAARQDAERQEAARQEEARQEAAKQQAAQEERLTAERRELLAAAGPEPRRVPLEGGGEGLILSDFTIHFAGDDVTLDNTGRASLNKAAELLRRYPQTRIVIAGHSAFSGAASGRLAVSRQRAQAAAGYLAQNGVDAGRITIEAHGAERPVAANDTFAGRAQNRRVELILIEE